MLLKRRFFPMFVGALAIFFCALFANAGEALQTSEYRGEYKGLSIKMTRQLTHIDGTRYRISSEAKAFLSRIDEYEEFEWLPNGQIRPISYYYKQKVFGAKRERRIEFNWQKMKAYYSDRNGEKTLNLESGMLGPNTYQLALQYDLLKGYSTFNYQFVYRGRIKHYTFKYEGEAKLEDGNDRFDSAILLRRADEGEDKETRIWFDPEQRFALVALEQIDDGDAHRLFMEWTRYSTAVAPGKLRKNHPNSQNDKAAAEYQKET